MRFNNMWAIYNETTRLWWNNDLGWMGSVEEATWYTNDQANMYHRDTPGKWIKVS